MRYLGGKSKIAKQIAAVVAPKGPWWEPFCGGLAVSVELAKFGPGVVSDVCEPLISMYSAIRAGWNPPRNVTIEQYNAAKSLPDTDPLKGFLGFGGSFGGKWFGGYAKGGGRNHQDESARAVERDVAALAGCEIVLASFFDVRPEDSDSDSRPEVIYCDPPYAETTGYSGVGAFDSPLFWDYCRRWATTGVRVFVSEYACPVPCDLVWSREKLKSAGKADQRQMAVERLFRVLP